MRQCISRRRKQRMWAAHRCLLLRRYRRRAHHRLRDRLVEVKPSIHDLGDVVCAEPWRDVRRRQERKRDTPARLPASTVTSRHSTTSTAPSAVSRARSRSRLLLHEQTALLPPRPRAALKRSLPLQSPQSLSSRRARRPPMSCAAQPPPWTGPPPSRPLPRTPPGPHCPPALVCAAATMAAGSGGRQ
jgi:hypothetical protein